MFTFRYNRSLKKNKIIHHLLIWVAIYLLWVLAFRSYSVSITKTMTIEFCYLVFTTLDYYVITIFIVPQFFFQKKNVLFVLSVIIVIAFSAWLRSLVALQMNLHFFKPAHTIDFTSLFLNSTINISLWVLVVTIGKMLIDRIQTQRQLELLEKERVNNELDYLKAQINPHALFNSLNTIYGHIDKANQTARNILLHLSELLRYQLYDCGAEKVILKKEIEYVTNYVAFQRLRKSEYLMVNLEIGYVEPGLYVAPLLLVVLIENAFKFVSNFCDKENKIHIKIYTQGTTLHSSFFNTKEVQQVPVPKNSRGIGIVNLERRLELLYPNKYNLTAHSEHDYYETNLIIDLA